MADLESMKLIVVIAALVAITGFFAKLRRGEWARHLDHTLLAAGLTALPACDGCSPHSSPGPLRPDENTRFHTPDRLGSSALVHDYQGNVIARDAHLPFGEPWVEWRAADARGPEYRLTGKERDPTSGSVAIGARHFLPALGRWASPDPLTLVAPMPRELASRERNPFAYAGNDPVRAADDNGLCVDCKVEHWIQAKWTPQMRADYNGRKPLTKQDVAKIARALDTADRFLTDFELAMTGAGPAGMALAGVEGVTLHMAVRGFRLLVRAKSGSARASAARQAVRTASAATKRACFAAGTLVWTANGLEPIETLDTGDRVWAADPVNGLIELEPIEETYRRTTDAVVELDVIDTTRGGPVESIETTPEHPFWVAERGWTQAAALAPGDVLYPSIEDELQVVDVTFASRDAVVFNLEVADLHTYFVGEHRVLVHNTCKQLRSLIKNDSLLVREAERAGKSVQGSINRLESQLRAGNMNPGRGTKSVFGNVLEARSVDGARVYFRNAGDDTIEILGKSNKQNQSKVISRLRELYE